MCCINACTRESPRLRSLTGHNLREVVISASIFAQCYVLKLPSEFRRIDNTCRCLRNNSAKVPPLIKISMCNDARTVIAVPNTCSHPWSKLYSLHQSARLPKLHGIIKGGKRSNKSKVQNRKILLYLIKRRNQHVYSPKYSLFHFYKNKHMNPPSTLQQEGMMLNGQKQDDTI